MYRLLSVLLVLVTASVYAAPPKKAKATPKPPTIDKKSSDRDQGTAIAWVREHCIVDGWEAKRWEYHGQYKGLSTGDSAWNVYVMRFAPDVVLGDDALGYIHFYFNESKLMWPRPSHPVDTIIGANSPPFIDMLRRGVESDLSGKRKKKKP